MTTLSQTGEHFRFTDLFDEPVDHLLIPIKGYEDQLLAPLVEAVKPIRGFFNEIDDYVYVALHNCRNSVDNLNQQESASIHLYTMQFQNGPSLYVLLNQSLRAENRDQLKPWFPFLKLFLTALHKLPSQSKIVWRGVRDVDLSSKYRPGTKFPWWGVSSCTTSIDILESNTFLGKHGKRTLFSIKCINGKSVANHSYYKKTKKEIILMPGTYFEVIGQLDSGHQLHIIQIEKILSPITFIKPPFLKLINTDSSSITYTKWKQDRITIAGGNKCGNKLNQLHHPSAIFIEYEQTVYIADSSNNRIVKWNCNENNDQIIAGDNERGNQTNQSNRPTDFIIDKENNSFIISDKGNRRVIRRYHQNNTNEEIIISDIDCHGLIMDKDRYLYVFDWKKNEVRSWKIGDKNGTLVAGGNRHGDHLNQLNYPTYIFIDENYSLYVSDAENHRVMKWIKDSNEGILVAGGKGRGNSLTQLSYPIGVIVNQFGQIYIADYDNHRVMRWCEGATEGTIIVGGNREGKQSNLLNFLRCLSFDFQGNLYVVDEGNHRIQKFEIDLN